MVNLAERASPLRYMDHEAVGFHPPFLDLAM